ncbi:hypothetical protein VE04_00963 [Pseudogymnoascus sp. 24MN13]|nr:hypothetical protein VE04_00963 [Pseudogymnoascus sp. 24MN13]
MRTKPNIIITGTPGVRDDALRDACCSWIDLVVVLRVNSTILYDRLKSRNYPELKLQENLDSEIMEVLLQEARDSYDEEIVVELTSNTSEEVDSNVARIEAWVAQWIKDNEGAEKEDS